MRRLTVICLGSRREKVMRKKVTALLITFVLVMSLLPACGNEQDKAEDKLPQ